MKTSLLLLAAVLAITPALNSRAEDSAMKCPMCEKMKQAKKAEAAAAKAKHELMSQTAELDKLVTAMNGSLGGEKIEAMAALLTRMVEINKKLCTQVAPAQREPAQKVKKANDGAPAADSHESASSEAEPEPETPKAAASEHDHH